MKSDTRAAGTAGCCGDTKLLPILTRTTVYHLHDAPVYRRPRFAVFDPEASTAAAGNAQEKKRKAAADSDLPLGQRPDERSQRRDCDERFDRMDDCQLTTDHCQPTTGKIWREKGIEYARRLLGHANISTTQLYMHLDDRELADAQDLVE